MKPTISRGSRGEDVKLLQKWLNLYQDGIFGPATESGVKEWQREHGLTVDGIVGPKTWESIYLSSQPINTGIEVINDKVYKRSKRRIDGIVIHCTATPVGAKVTRESIRQTHLARGFSDIGYHYLIMPNGKIVIGRDVDISGAHVYNHNSHTIGIAYVGGVKAGCKGDKPSDCIDTRTPQQKEALLSLLKGLRRLYPKATIKGHRDYSPDLNGDGIIEPREWIKLCPCFDAQTEYKDL